MATPNRRHKTKPHRRGRLTTTGMGCLTRREATINRDPYEAHFGWNHAEQQGLWGCSRVQSLDGLPSDFGDGCEIFVQVQHREARDLSRRHNDQVGIGRSRQI